MTDSIFPVIRPTVPSDLGAIPYSTDTSGIYTTLRKPFYIDPNFNQDGNGIFLDSSGNFYSQDFIKDKTLIDAVISPCILSGMVMSIDQNNPNVLNVSAGRFVVHESTTSPVDILYDFAGIAVDVVALNVNPNRKFLLYVYVQVIPSPPAPQPTPTITFLETLSNDPTICKVGEVAFDFLDQQFLREPYNVADRGTFSFMYFTDYIRSFGVFHSGISVRRNPNNTMATDGGRIKTYSTGDFQIVQADQEIDFIRINEAGVEESATSQLPILFLKHYYPVGTTTMGTINANSEYVIWIIYCGTGGRFFLLKPQSVVQPVQTIEVGDILNYVETCQKPITITQFCTPIACIVVNGSDNSLADCDIYQIKNKLSGGVGYVDQGSSNSGTIYTLPVPVPLVSADEPVGTTQLASDGIHYILQSGVEGLDTHLGNVAVSYNFNTKNAGIINSKSLPDNKVFWVNTLPFESSTLIDNTNGQILSNITGLGTPVVRLSSAINSNVNTQFFNAVSSLIPDGANLLNVNGNYHIFGFALINVDSIGINILSQLNVTSDFLLASQTVAQNMHTNFKNAGINVTQRVNWDITTNYSNIYNAGNSFYLFPYIAIHSSIHREFRYSNDEQLNINYTASNSGYNAYTYHSGFGRDDNGFFANRIGYYFSVEILRKKIVRFATGTGQNSLVNGYCFIKKGI